MADPSVSIRYESLKKRYPWLEIQEILSQLPEQEFLQMTAALDEAHKQLRVPEYEADPELQQEMSLERYHRMMTIIESVRGMPHSVQMKLLGYVKGKTE